MAKRLVPSSIIVVSGTIIWAAAASAQQLAYFKTSPSALASLSQEQLNEYGFNLINEAYTIFSAVGSKTGEISRGLNQTDKKAVKQVKSLLDDHALFQNARLNYGIRKTKFFPTDIDDFKLSKVAVTSPESGILVLSYYVTLPNRVDLQTKTVFSGNSMPRLTVLRWSDAKKQWLIFSHADFDTQAGTVCAKAPRKGPEKSQFKKADIELGRALLEKRYNELLRGIQTDSKIKGGQFVFAEGERQVDYGPNRLQFLRKPKMNNIEATRTDNLLAVRYDAPPANTLDGNQLDPAVKPRLLTFMQRQDGTWERIGAAVFSVTTKTASNVKCIEPTVN